jgi:hypothetical protein
MTAALDVYRTWNGPELCVVSGCERRRYCRGRCNTHYRQWLRNLDGPRPPVVWPSLPQRRPRCVVDGCHRETRSHSSQWCETHYYRNRRNGHLELLDTRKPVVTYGAAHQRIRYDKGSATKYRCVICGKPAQQWSYDNADPNELTQEMPNGSVCRYSLSPDHYQPACLSCHKRRDNAHRALAVISRW